MGQLILNTTQIEELLKSPAGDVARDMGRRGLAVANQAKINASGRPGPNVQTDRLRGSIDWAFAFDSDGLYVVIGTNVEYARWVEEGTDPVLILPKTKKALYWKGARHPVAYVLRVGNEPYPYLVPALSAAGG